MEFIISGSILIVLQFIADVGNSNGGLNFFKNVTTFESFIYSFIAFTAYCSVGIIGLIIHIIGIKNKRKGKKATIILHKTNEKKYTVLSYVFATLVGIICFAYMIALFDDISISFLFITIS